MILYLSMLVKVSKTVPNVVEYEFCAPKGAAWFVLLPRLLPATVELG